MTQWSCWGVGSAIYGWYLKDTNAIMCFFNQEFWVEFMHSRVTEFL